ncbi:MULTISPECIES: hypothetical protein [Burkholderiaceae]|uniref:hypothetical protein n=1 Tax=Burkholderiaceae TaxID=119060 RepID=UPI00074C81B2|nr:MULTISPECIES: hypothetical protein [Burkholderiaceae]SAL58117.1 hypothetical protein AWB71_03181 [Caballeronia peredens]
MKTKFSDYLASFAFVLLGAVAFGAVAYALLKGVLVVMLALRSGCANSDSGISGPAEA